MRYTAIITHFSRRPDGRWLTTGDFDVFHPESRAELDALVAEHAGGPVTIDIDSCTFHESGYVGLHSTELLWADEKLLDERDRATIH